MSDTEQIKLKTEDCPKRVWVLSVLTDDEVLDDPRELPRGLAFHLSRCPSCRAIAEPLTRASSALNELSETTFPDGLLDAANRQASEALRSGGRPTGRVRVPDEEDFPPDRVTLTGRRWFVGARYAAAAAVVLAVATFGVSTVRKASERFAGDSRPVVDHALNPEAIPVPSPSDVWEGAAEQLATGIDDDRLPVPVSGDSPQPLPAGFVEIDAPSGGSLAETPHKSKLDLNGAPQDAQEPYRHRHNGRRGTAWCNDPRCVPTAVVLPGGARRMMQSKPAPIDRRP